MDTDNKVFREPELRWLQFLPPTSRLYSLIALASLVIIWRITEQPVPPDATRQYLPYFLLAITVISMALAYMTNREEGRTLVTVQELMTSVNEMRESLEPITRDFETLKDMVIDTVPNNGLAHLLTTAKKQAMKEAHDEAITTLNLLAGQEPNNPRVYSNLSYSYQKKGDIDSAINYITKAINLCNNHMSDRIPRYLYHRARYYVEKFRTTGNNNEIQLAANDLKIASERDPIYYGNAVIASPDFKEVLAYISKERV